MSLLLVLLTLGGCGGGDWAADAPAPGAADAPPAAAAASAPGAAEVATLTIRRQPEGVDVREGEVAQFSVEVEGAGAIGYQWLRDGEVITGETGAALRLKATAADHLARISVIVRSGRSALHSDSALLRVGRG